MLLVGRLKNNCVKWPPMNWCQSYITPQVRNFNLNNKNDLNMRTKHVFKWQFPQRNFFSNYTAFGTLWNSNALISTEKINNFMATFPDIAKDLATACEEHEAVAEVGVHCSEFVHYVIPNGKYLRAFLTIAAYEMLEKKENITAENLRLANIMGWIVELIQASICTLDDIMDRSEIRRGTPCWYRKDNVGLSAINDALFLQQGVYFLLKKNFSKHHYYLLVIELVHDTILQATLGQTVDCLSTKNGKPDFEQFTMNKFNYIRDYGTSCLAFELPIILGMFMSNLYNADLREEVRVLCKKIGEIYKMQEDYMDCFGDFKAAGKKGNDVREGKLNWFAVTALQKANYSQKEIMKEYYGKSDTKAVNIILNMYKELNLLNLYNACLEDTFHTTRSNISNFSKSLQLHELFSKLVDSLCDRKC